MAERKRRDTRSGRNASGKRSSRRTGSKKKKVNLFPAVAAVVLLVVIIIVFNAITGDRQGEDDGQGVFLSGQPEFFSTIRPEKLNSAEIDTIDDPAKAASYFENSLFVGDAQMTYIQNAKLENAQIGSILEKALFLTADGYTWASMAGEFSGGALTFNLYGDYVSMTGAIEKSGAKKVFLQLGRVDLAAGDTSAALSAAQTALRSLKQAAPQTEIIVLPLTPNTAESTAVPDNTAIALFNSGMRDFCSEEGILFADMSEVFPTDGLQAEYCANVEDQGDVLNAEGCLALVTELLEIVSSQQTVMPENTPVPIAQSTDNSGTQTQENGTNAAGRVPVTE